MEREVNTSFDYWERVEEFVLQLKRLLPTDLDYELIGDGGFVEARMFALCRRVGWDQVIRISGSYAVKIPGCREFIQLSLFDDGHYRQVIIEKTNPTEGINLAVCPAPPPSSAGIWQALWIRRKPPPINKRRMRIKQTFKGLKSVLKWELPIPLSSRPTVAWKNWWRSVA